jgi:thiamine-phosphate pyrophosphorylase
MQQARYAIEARIDMLQVREGDLEASAIARLVSAIVELARGSATRIVVNDRLDVALACGASGVHLPASALPPAAVRTITPKGFLVGRSVHSPSEAAAVGADVDYIVAGTVWATASKPAGADLIGPAGLASIVSASLVPVLAIGGVTLERLSQVRETGAAGAAAIGMFMGGAPEGVCHAVPLEPIVRLARARFDTSETAS